MSDPVPPMPPAPVTPPPPTGEPLSALPPPSMGQQPADAAPLDVPDDAIVVVDRVSKWFGDLVAVSDVSFAVGPGVTALLGPNGAGKSTMLRMLCGLAVPSSGTVRVLGADPRTDTAVAANIGVAPQQESVFGYLTASEFVTASAELQGLDSPADRARAVLATVELDPDDPRRLPTYSKGMRQRVKLAQAIVHDPQVILLDEPLSGLDPRQRVHMVELFHRLAGAGRAVIVSSHVLEEVERFGSDVVVITKGRLAAQGDFREIRALMDDRPTKVRVRTDRPRSLASELIKQPEVLAVNVDHETIVVHTADIAGLARSIAPISVQLSARLHEVRPLDEDLESVFRYLVNR